MQLELQRRVAELRTVYSPPGEASVDPRVPVLAACDSDGVSWEIVQALNDGLPSEIAMQNEYDVIVFGGGTAGVIAVIQAARAGAKTLLAEKSGVLGGTLTAGVCAVSSFHSFDRQIIAGIGWELVSRAVREEGRQMPGPIGSGDAWKSCARVSPAVYAALCDQAVLDAGAELLLHVMPASAELRDDGWHVQICTKSGLRETGAKVLIDATGDANVVGIAGFELEYHSPLQPGSLMIRCEGYDPELLDCDAIDRALAKAMERGEIKLTDVAWAPDSIRGFLYGRGGNHINTPDAHTSEGRTATEVEARASLLRVFRFMRRQKGLELFRVERFAPECSLRDSAVIRGKTRITGEDYASGRLFDDALCYTWYGIDVHLNDGKGVDFRHLEQGVVPTIPRGALLPEGSRFLAAAGRCISSDRAAQGGIRVEATCMAVGQAAGAMAALSAQRGVDLADLPLEDIRALLREHGAIVPPAVKAAGESGR